MSRGALREFSVLQARPPKSINVEAEGHETDWKMLFHAAGIAALTVPSAVVPFTASCSVSVGPSCGACCLHPHKQAPLGPTLLLHVPTIIVEGEAYVVAMLGVWLWWQAVIDSHGERWKKSGGVERRCKYACTGS